jgi:hypothetical protein
MREQDASMRSGVARSELFALEPDTNNTRLAMCAASAPFSGATMDGAMRFALEKQVRFDEREGCNR